VTAPTCLECGSSAHLVDGKTIYPHRSDLFGRTYWLCECGAYCGCHRGTTIPLGSPAGTNTRRARGEAHKAFDPIWKSGQMSRRRAYLWLSRQTGIDRKVCHIGMMTVEQAKLVVAVCKGVPA
jgi:hypothetical protein